MNQPSSSGYLVIGIVGLNCQSKKHVLHRVLVSHISSMYVRQRETQTKETLMRTLEWPAQTKPLRCTSCRTSALPFLRRTYHTRLGIVRTQKKMEKTARGLLTAKDGIASEYRIIVLCSRADMIEQVPRSVAWDRKDRYLQRAQLQAQNVTPRYATIIVPGIRSYRPRAPAYSWTCQQLCASSQELERHPRRP